jgi:hypothetical protein
MSNAERPTSNVERKSHVETGGSALLSSFRRSPSGEKDVRPRHRTRHAGTHIAPKNVTILGLPRLYQRLHIVCPKDSQRYYLLFTMIHKLFAPLFTRIRILFRTSTLPNCHDSTKTRHPARLT